MADAEGFRALYDASEVMYDITAHQKLPTFLPHMLRPTQRHVKGEI